MIWLLYAVDAWIVGTYIAFVLGARPIRGFHWANAIGGPLIVVGTVMTAGWQPLLVLTIVFSVAGWIGLRPWRHA